MIQRKDNKAYLALASHRIGLNCFWQNVWKNVWIYRRSTHKCKMLEASKRQHKRFSRVVFYPSVFEKLSFNMSSLTLFHLSIFGVVILPIFALKSNFIWKSGDNPRVEIYQNEMLCGFQWAHSCNVIWPIHHHWWAIGKVNIRFIFRSNFDKWCSEDVKWADL